MRTLKHRCEPSAARDGLLRFAQPMATLRSPSPQRPSGSTSWIFWEHSDEMTGNILARQWHPRLGTSTDEAIRILILIVALDRHLRDFAGILQADAYGGYNELYQPSRLPGPITSALCWAHARRQFFELADIAANARRGKNAAAISPIALEAVRRIDVLFDIERGINGLRAEERLRVRHEQSAPHLTVLEAWLRDERARLSSAASVAEPIDYMLKRWHRFARFIDDGRICLTNNAAERALRGFALGRKSWLFAGSERGADRAAAMATLIMTAKLNEVDPLAWLADVLARIAGIPQGQLHELLPWEWKCATSVTAQAA